MMGPHSHRNNFSSHSNTPHAHLNVAMLVLEYRRCRGHSCTPTQQNTPLQTDQPINIATKNADFEEVNSGAERILYCNQKLSLNDNMYPCSGTYG